MNVNRTVENLKKNGYKVSFFKNKEDATNYFISELKNYTIGFGDSGTLMSMNLFEKLSKKNIVVDPQNCQNGKDFFETARECYGKDIYITSVNGISETGELVNIDGTGNRIGASLFGHKKVYFVVGTNKIEENLDRAIWRARNIAAPLNAKRLGMKTPCAIKGDKCYDCSSKERICNSLNIYLKKMDSMDMEVVLIDEKLGL